MKLTEVPSFHSTEIRKGLWTAIRWTFNQRAWVLFEMDFQRSIGFWGRKIKPVSSSLNFPFDCTSFWQIFPISQLNTIVEVTSKSEQIHNQFGRINSSQQSDRSVSDDQFECAVWANVSNNHMLAIGSTVCGACWCQNQIRQFIGNRLCEQATRSIEIWVSSSRWAFCGLDLDLELTSPFCSWGQSNLRLGIDHRWSGSQWDSTCCEVIPNRRVSSTNISDSAVRLSLFESSLELFAGALLCITLQFDQFA